jgi:hypothetical protein
VTLPNEKAASDGGDASVGPLGFRYCAKYTNSPQQEIDWSKRLNAWWAILRKSSLVREATHTRVFSLNSLRMAKNARLTGERGEFLTAGTDF